jgi:YHS domain-containing protein
VKRIHIALVAVLALGILAPMTHAATRAIKRKAISAVCPVTKTKIPNVSRSAGKSVYKGKTYYFCTRSCKLKFDKRPAKYMAAPKPVSAVCPVMGTKIPDVTKAAGKSVYKGKTYYFCCPGCKPLFDKDPEKYVGTAK